MNQLPSLPRQVYQAEQQYRQASGFYAQLNARAASSYYVDFANTLSAPSYTLWGAKFGYEAPSKQWEVFVDARNLTNQRYATAANTAYDAKGRDSANFYPGMRSTSPPGWRFVSRGWQAIASSLWPRSAADWRYLQTASCNDPWLITLGPANTARCYRQHIFAPHEPRPGAFSLAVLAGDLLCQPS